MVENQMSAYVYIKEHSVFKLTLNDKENISTINSYYHSPLNSLVIEWTF